MREIETDRPIMWTPHPLMAVQNKIADGAGAMYFDKGNNEYLFLKMPHRNVSVASIERQIEMVENVSSAGWCIIAFGDDLDERWITKHLSDIREEILTLRDSRPYYRGSGDIKTYYVVLKRTKTA